MRLGTFLERADNVAHTLALQAHLLRDDGRNEADMVRWISVLRSCGAAEDIDCVVVHQPTPVLLRRLADALGIPADRLVVVGDEVGNIGAASAPYALASAAGHRLRPGDRVLLAVFGAGMTWGSALLTWSGAPALASTPTSARPESEGVLR